MKRELYRLAIQGAYTWEHFREIWHIKQSTVEVKTGKSTFEERERGAGKGVVVIYFGAS